MTRNRRFLGWIVITSAAFLVGWTAISQAYVEAPLSLGSVVSQSSNVMLMRVEKVDREKNLIIYRKIRDIKGKHPTDVIKHNIGRGGFNPREWQYPMQWAEPGKLAVFFHNGGASETCIGTYWYQAYAGGEWWGMSHGEPFMLRSYSGNPEKLASLVAEMLNNKEVVASCMVDGNKDDLHLRRAKVQRVKASLKLLDYNPKRDFVGWGGEDFRRLLGMPGFTHYSGLTRVDPEAQAISSVDFDGDGKPDLCLVGAGRVVLLRNGGESLTEVQLPGATGARAAVWADYNGDGRPDLLLATPLGPKLYTNLGSGNFRDDSALLPKAAANTLTAAAWIDHDGDGRPDILLANGYHGLRLYRNLGMDRAGKWFEDVSTVVGLGPNGLGAGLKGDTLTVCDVNADGRPDFLYGTGTGMLILNTRTDKGAVRFIHDNDAGIVYQTGKAGPIFGDFDNDGHPDLFVPQKTGCKLFRNTGQGKFVEVTKKAGDLINFSGWAACAAWGDFDNDGHLDLMVGCLGGTNRFFRNKGDGTFEDATEAVGLHQRVFNTQAICLVDLNNDGVLDVILNNEGQESAVLLGSPSPNAKCVPLTVQLAGKGGIIGSQVRVADKDGRKLQVREISGGSGRGGQAAPLAHFALEPGTYRVEVRFSSGLRRVREVIMASAPVRSLIDDQAGD